MDFSTVSTISNYYLFKQRDSYNGVLTISNAKPAERPWYTIPVVDTNFRGVSVLESVGLINCKNISVSVTHAQTSVLDQCQYCYSNHILIGVQTMVKRVVGSWACKSRSSVVN